MKKGKGGVGSKEQRDTHHYIFSCWKYCQPWSLSFVVRALRNIRTFQGEKIFIESSFLPNYQLWILDSHAFPFCALATKKPRVTFSSHWTAALFVLAFPVQLSILFNAGSMPILMIILAFYKPISKVVGLKPKIVKTSSVCSHLENPESLFSGLWGH